MTETCLMFVPGSTQERNRDVTDDRQSAYDAVFQVIQRQGYDAGINAFAWRCVHAALNAVNVGVPVDPQTGQRFADEPGGLVEVEDIDPEEFEVFKARWREQHGNTGVASQPMDGSRTVTWPALDEEWDWLEDDGCWECSATLDWLGRCPECDGHWSWTEPTKQERP